MMLEVFKFLKLFWKGFYLDSLAVGAEVATTVADRDALNRGTADGAGLTTTVGDLKLEVGGAYFTARTKISICTSSLITDG